MRFGLEQRWAAFPETGIRCRVMGAGTRQPALRHATSPWSGEQPDTLQRGERIRFGFGAPCPLCLKGCLNLLFQRGVVLNRNLGLYREIAESRTRNFVGHFCESRVRQM
jgi:hypothetical protein